MDYLVGRADTDQLTEKEEQLLHDIDNGLNLEELQKKYLIKVDGIPATKEEIEGAIAFIRSLRSLK